MTTKILFVCMGNICRSPTAEGVFRQTAEQSGLLDRLYIDSAGTHDYHVGRPPDSRAQTAASRRGYDLSSLRGRQVSPRDFDEFDYILAMDGDNLANLERICPREQRHKLHLFLEFSERFSGEEVPDPYYGGGRGFERVLDMVEDASHGLLARVKSQDALK
jgi:protein-tyrosine phosphatase